MSRPLKYPDCECGGCDWDVDEVGGDRNEYVVMRHGRCWLPPEAELEVVPGRQLAFHRRNLLAKTTGGEFHVYQLVQITG